MRKACYARILMPLLILAMLLAGILPAGRAEARYNYTVRIYAGAQGTISGGEHVSYLGLNYGDRVNFNLRDVQLKDNSKYYVKGIRLAGRDNNTIYASPSFLVETDADYVIAYGLLTDAVAYTVEYVDAAGNELAPSEIYYGNVGDKPVVAFLYIEGYKPNAYNITRTLQADASKNIFRFVYSRVDVPDAPGADAGTDDAGDDTGGTGTGTRPGTGTGTGGVNINPGGIPVIPADQGGDADDGDAGEDGGDEDEDIPDEDVPLDEGDPAETLDIDDELVPLADTIRVISDAKLLGIPVWLEVLTALAIAAGCYYAYRRHKERSRT